MPVAEAAGPLRTAIRADATFSGADAELAFSRARGAGTTAIRVELSWAGVAPAVKPPGFDARNPNDPGYDWSRFDRVVQRAVRQGLEPLAVVNAAPSWARRSPAVVGSAPDANDLARFAAAAAARYSGRTPEIPRVRWWQLWNEPNVSTYFTPQFRGEAPVSPILYRTLVNAFAAAVHRAHSDNLVIAGGLSPFTVRTKSLETIGPLRFMRRLLCMSGGSRPKPTCKTQVHFDVWSHHPYTSGGPTHTASNPNDVSLGDLPEMKRLLLAGAKAGHVLSRAKVRFWVTEFSWDTNPPDPRAVPIRLQARWTAEALYRMWRIGVDLVTWNQLRDDLYPQEPVQSGLWFRGGARLSSDRPKLTLTAFKFPFVAYRQHGGIFFWGRTPWGRPGRLVLETSSGHGWRRLLRLSANRYGVFSSLITSPVRRGYVRARLLPGGATLSFSLARPPDRFGPPFG